MGACYFEFGKIDSSNYYYNQVYDYAIKTKNRQWQGISSGNLGYNLFKKQKYKQAIPLFKKDIEIGTEFKDWNLVSSALINLGELYLKLDKNKEALEIGIEAKKVVLLSFYYDFWL